MRRVLIFVYRISTLLFCASTRTKAADTVSRVHKDKIGEVSIRLGNSDETWTRALRHVLLDLKILLADAAR